MTTHIIVGDGAAGIAAAQAIRRRDPEALIAVISDDPQPHYYRAALTNYLFGQLRDEQLWGVPPDFYARLRIGRFYGRVTAVDTESMCVALDSGLTVPYDRLLIASGAAPGTLNVPGADLVGVVTFRTLQDARRIVDLAPEMRQAVIVGGGPLGLEWVQGLRHRGVDVVYIVREQTLLPRLLDPVASELVVRRLRDAGVTVLLGDEIAEMHAQTSSQWPGIASRAVGGVTTRSGRFIPCQLVGVAIGARPNVAFLRGSGVATNGGVVTDRHLRTAAAGVYAAGDVAHVRDARHGVDLRPAGLWQPARKQGQVAGANMASAEPVEIYDPGAIPHVTHLYNLDFAGVGETNPSAGDKVQVLSAWPGENAYRKLVLRNGRVSGCLMIGDRSGLQLFKRLIDLGLDVTPIQHQLLDPHFDLATWLQEQQAARTPQPMRLGGMAGRLGGFGAPAVRDVAAAAAAPPSRAAASGARRAARLIAGANVHHLPSDRPATIGRDAACDVVLGNSSVSRRHAEIVSSAAGFVLRDLGSSNGTWVGLTRLHPNVPHGIQPGDTVRIGQVFLTFADAEAEPEPLAVGGPVAVLVGADGPLALQPLVTSIGRDMTSDVVVPGTSASRLHAQIRRAADGAFYLNDMGSMNGVQVNGGRIAGTHRLADGDVIDIGKARYTFRLTGAAGGARPDAARAVLTAITGPATGTRFRLGDAELVIGRDADAGISLNDPLVSRRHARVRASSAAYVIEDLGSSNGTLVNGVEITGPHRLSNDDLIEIGQTRFVFRMEGAATPLSLPDEGETSIVTTHDLQAAIQETRLGFATQRHPVFVLVLENGPRKGQQFPFAAGEEAIIGRDQACAIVLQDPSVSRQHARLTVLPDGRTVLSDLGSRSGTVVNGSLIGGPYSLRDDDRIVMGGAVLRFSALDE